MPAEESDNRKTRPNQRLEGWDSVAFYLGKSPRTYQRYKGKDAPPIYREGKGVFAYTDDLDRWLKTRTTGPSTDVDSQEDAILSAEAAPIQQSSESRTLNADASHESTQNAEHASTAQLRRRPWRFMLPVVAASIVGVVGWILFRPPVLGLRPPTK